MAKKGGMPIYKTVDDYINNQAEEAQGLLIQLREIIKETVPESIEIPDSKVPSFTLNTDKSPTLQLMIAAYKKYVSFYPFQSTIEYFEEELGDYDLGKGTIKFPFDAELPKELLKKIILYRKGEL